jgi:hypothetical protein
MVDQAEEGGFQVRDRRRQVGEEPSGTEERTGPARPVAEPPPTSQPTPQPPTERSLVGLFVMLASFAMAGLEGVADSATGRGHRDLAQTAEVIDTLMLLREKTEGHRSAQETQTLEALIYDLQIRYVDATRRPG